MAYKTQFRPLERLGRDGWRRMDEAGGDTPFEHELPMRLDRKRILVDA